MPHEGKMLMVLVFFFQKTFFTNPLHVTPIFYYFQYTLVDLFAYDRGVSPENFADGMKTSHKCEARFTLTSIMSLTDVITSHRRSGLSCNWVCMGESSPLRGQQKLRVTGNSCLLLSESNFKPSVWQMTVVPLSSLYLLWQTVMTGEPRKTQLEASHGMGCHGLGTAGCQKEQPTALRKLEKHVAALLRGSIIQDPKGHFSSKQGF